MKDKDSRTDVLLHPPHTVCVLPRLSNHEPPRPGSVEADATDVPAGGEVCQHRPDLVRPLAYARSMLGAAKED